MVRKSLIFSLFLSFLVLAFLLGRELGAYEVRLETLRTEISGRLSDMAGQTLPAETAAPETPAPPKQTASQKETPSTTLAEGYSGPELWQAVNSARVEHGVAPLQSLDVFCTIAAIRLNQILELGRLDNHEGFAPTVERYREGYNLPTNVAEFLVSGWPTPGEAVADWLNSLGHSRLITGGEFVWGCTYARGGFGVAIAGF